MPKTVRHNRKGRTEESAKTTTEVHNKDLNTRTSLISPVMINMRKTTSTPKEANTIKCHSLLCSGKIAI